MKREVITRKEHECFGCGELMPKGAKAEYAEGRSPVYDERDKQIGISYWKYYCHAYRCDLPPDIRAACEAGNHEWEIEHKLDYYEGCNPVYVPTERDICRQCAQTRPMQNDNF